MSYRTYLRQDIIEPYVQDPDGGPGGFNRKAYFAWAEAMGSEQNLRDEADYGFGYISEYDFEDCIREETYGVPLDVDPYVDWESYAKAQKRNFNAVEVDGVTFYFD